MAAYRPKVLFVTAWYPTRDRPAGGGFVRDHARAAALSAEVAVVHWTGPDRDLGSPWRMVREDDPALSGGIPTWRLSHREGAWKPPSTLRWLRSFFAAWDTLSAAGFTPDLVHAHVFTVALPVAVLARAKRIPWVLTEHASNFPRRLLSARDLWKIRRAFPRAARILPVSRFLREAITNYGIRGNFQVVPNAVDLGLFHPPRGPREPGPARLLTVALQVPVKGLDILLEALGRLPAEAPLWNLDLAGDGPERESLERRAAALGLLPRVRFCGMLSRAEVALRMRAADLFVLPSLSENLPCVLQEALASGLPVVASRVGGIPEFIGEQQGELVPPGDPQALAGALLRALARTGPPDREALARAALPYSHAAVGGQLAALYREVLGR